MAANERRMEDSMLDNPMMIIALMVLFALFLSYDNHHHYPRDQPTR